MDRAGERTRPLTTALRLLTLADAAARTGRNAELLRRWCAAGRIPCHRVGRDWMVDPADIASIEGMPRRGMTKGGARALGDLGILSPGLQEAVRACLDDGEVVREVVLGIEDSALVATTRRIFMAHDGTLVTDPQSGRVATWPLDWVRRIQLTAGASAGALVLTSQDPSDRPLVVVLGRPGLVRAEDLVASLRARLVANGNFSADGDRR